MPEKRTFIIHPFILAIYPILFYYNLNKHVVWFSETLMPMATLLFVAFLVFVLLKIIFKRTTKAGILTSFILILFFSYEAIQTGVVNSKIWDLILNLDPNLLWSYGILLTLAATGLCFWNGRSHKVTKYLNAVSVILIAFPLMGLANHKISNLGSKLFAPTQHDYAVIPDNFHYVGSKPDIYYIIMDGYMRDDVMEEFWGFDNSEFINYLANHGFYVAPKSRSNYPNTGLSLASSLNMGYLSTTLGTDTVNRINNISLLESIEKNVVANFLKSIGYLYIHLSDDATDTKKNGEANIVITNRKYISSFSQYLLSKTIFKNIKTKSLDEIQIKRNNILYGFKKLEEIPRNDEPTFTFAHFLMPHGPQAFDKNGDIPIQSASESDKYFGEVLYANKKIRHLVEYILANSEIPPIIIIQGDHGYSFTISNRPGVDEVKKRYSNFSAYYLPGQGGKKLYKTITPVNSFRLIFDHFFGTQYGLLEDKSYFPIHRHPETTLIPMPSEDHLSNRGLSAWITILKQTILKQTILKQTILNKPDLAEAHALLGRYYILLERFPEAKNSLEKALHLNPNLIWAQISLALTYSLTKDYSMALDAINQAIQMNSKISEAHKTLGEIKMATGNYSEAISSFHKAIKISPKNTGAISGLGRAYSLLNDKNRSLLYFKKLVLISQTFANYNDLGSAYAQFGLDEEAILNFKKALEINSRSAVAYYNLGNIYIKRKDYEEGINFYHKAVEQKPGYIKAYYSLGATYETLNEPLKAAEYYQKTLALNPKHTLAHFGLGNAFLKSNQIESALLEYKEAINLNPEHIPSYVNIGTAQMRLGMFNQGRATFEAILSKKPSIAKIHKYLGIIHAQMKESPDKAIFHLQESLRLAPNQPEAAQIKLMIQTVTKRIA